MRLHGFLGLVMAWSLHAQTVVLYDVDFTAMGAQVGQEIGKSQGPFPGRTEATELISGQVTIEDGPLGLSGTAALMVSEKEAPSSTFAYSQHSYWLFGGGVYVFRKNRIEMEFKFGNPGLLAADEGLTIYTEGGVANFLAFRPNGEVLLNANVVDPGSGSMLQSESVVGTFDPTQTVQLVWELDSEVGSSMVLVNGVVSNQVGLALRSSGIRNYELYPAPWQVRLRFSDLDSQSSLALRTLRVSGCDYDGPLFHTIGDPLSSLDQDLVVVSIEIPVTGAWQPEFSLDLKNWIPFGIPLSTGAFFDSVLCGKVGDQGMYVRLVEVE